MNRKSSIINRQSSILLNKLLITFILTLSTIASKASEISDSVKLSLLTVTPGTELYSTFGHTAIRLVDYKNGHDIIFNYGTFDFRTPNFYLKFAMGLLDYQLSIESFEDFKAGCAYENRAVTEQVLNLTHTQKDKMIYLLLENYKPGNRMYRYKFFTDNCSTRPRDIISLTLGSPEYLENTKVKSEETYRQLFTSYLTGMSWNQFGIELLLGKMTDKEAGYNALFLPDNLKVAIDKASYNGTPLEQSEQVILENIPIERNNPWFSPIIMSLIVILMSLIFQMKKNFTPYFDTIFFVLFGLLGLFITTLSFASNHEELQSNYVILFYLPLIFFIPFLGGKKRKILSLICFSVIAFSFLSLPLMPQSFNPAVLFLSIAIAIRCFFNFAKISNTRITWI